MEPMLSDIDLLFIKDNWEKQELKPCLNKVAASFFANLDQSMPVSK